jgi:hypothetical protein
MYFCDPLADLIDTQASSKKHMIRQISTTLFVYKQSAVVLRYVTKADLIFLANGCFDKTHYLIDDNLFALGREDRLPIDYRKRLVDYRDGLLKEFLPYVTHVVAPSSLILESYAGKIRHLLHPALCHQLGSLDHHNKSDTFDIVFAATRSHVKDIEMIAPQLLKFLDENPRAKLTTFLGRHAPKSLKNVRGVKHLEPMSWQAYRKFLTSHRFHVAIAPAIETLFNRSRSISRIYDHAAFGAAGIYSDLTPFSDFVDHESDGFLIGLNNNAWHEILSHLILQPENVAKIAAAGQSNSLNLGTGTPVRKFWIEELGLDIG